MKKASKFLSMFLLVAMCLSLMGGAAYATNDDSGFLSPFGSTTTTTTTTTTNDETTVTGGSGSGTDETSFLSTYSNTPAAAKAWKISGTDTESNSFAEIVAAAKKGQVVMLVNGASDNTYNKVDKAVTVDKAITINLNGGSLDLANSLVLNNNVSIVNGSFDESSTQKIITYGTVTLSNMGVTTEKDAEEYITKQNNGAISISSDGTVPSTAASVSVTIDGTTSYYSEVTDAFAKAAEATNENVTINMLLKDTDYAIDGENAPLSYACASLTVNMLSGDTLDLGNVTEFSITNLTINGGAELRSDITMDGKSLTVSTNKVGKLTAINSGSITISGKTVESITLNNATLNCSSNVTVDELTLTEGDTKDVLNVSNGTFGTTENTITFPATHGTSKVSGGNWYLPLPENDDSNAQNLNNFKTYTTTGTAKLINSTYYQVGKGATGTSGTVISSSNSSTPASGSYTSSDDFVYTLTTSGDVAVWPSKTATWKSGDGNLYFKYTPNTAYAQGLDYAFYIDSTSWQLPGDQYTDDKVGTMSIGKAYLATLSEGTHTLYIHVTEDDGYTYEASTTFYIGASLTAVDTDKHVTGSTKSLQYVCSQPISRVWVGSNDITDNYGTYYTLSSNRKTITLTSDFLNDRTAGSTYTLTVQTDGGDQPSASFQILTTAQASSSPKTGDSSNLALWAAVLVLSGGAAVAVLPRLKKD